MIAKPREIYVEDGTAGLVSVEIIDADGIKQIVKLRDELDIVRTLRPRSMDLGIHTAPRWGIPSIRLVAPSQAVPCGGAELPCRGRGLPGRAIASATTVDNSFPCPIGSRSLPVASTVVMSCI
jgi:hypothetical protein